MALFRNHPVRIQPYFGYRNEDRLILTVRALRADKPAFTRRKDARSTWRALRALIAQYASKEVAGLPVRIEYLDGDNTVHECTVITDAEGYAHFDVEYTAPHPLPDRTSWETVTLWWDNRDGEQCVEAHLLAPASTTRLGVISDIDDTIIETGITGGLFSVLRNWKRLLAQMPDQRVAVPGADAFYNALGGPAGEEGHRPGEMLPAPRRPFFYVSSSPWNLFSYLAAFKQVNRLPLGPMLLRDWGLNRRTFGHSSHGSHKSDSIRAILHMYGEFRFALVGDDTQGDLPAFARVVEENPGRVAAIFIRTAGASFSAEEKIAQATIKAAGVPLWMGDSYTVGNQFLRAAGLSDEGHAAALVEAVEDIHEDREGTAAKAQ